MNNDYQSQYRGTEMDARWGKAGTAVQGVRVNGELAPKDENNVVSIEVSGGTGDYEELSHLPKVNNVELKGNKTSAELGLQSTITDLASIRSGAALGATALQEVPNTYRTAAEQDEIDAGKASAEDVEAINEKIPSQASSDNKLADKDFVNSSINAFAAFYITSDAAGDAFATKAALLTGPYYNGGVLRTPTKNDYAIVLADESKGGATTRYSYDGTAWAYQYKVNDTPLTAAQLAALNSGITSGAVSKLGDLPTAEELATALAGKQSALTSEQLANIADVPNKASDADVVKHTAQSLTDEQKEQARENIDAPIVTPVETETTSQASYEIAPNKVVKLGELASTVALTLASGVAGKASVYDFIFSTGATAPTITWPTGLSWGGNDVKDDPVTGKKVPDIQASKTYEISISENLGMCQGF